MEPQCKQLYFDPDKHPEDTLKAFNEFTELFDLRYDAQFPDPPKVSMEAAIQRWKVENQTDDVPDPKPTLQQFDQIREAWRSKDRVAKFLGMYSSSRFISDWRAAEPGEALRKAANWNIFLTKVQSYYKPTENLTLKNFHFRELLQEPHETFTGFCNRVDKEAKHCAFKCASADCTAESTAIRDQIVIGTHHNEIREEALKKSWDLPTLRKEGMKIESATRSGAEIAGENTINRVGKYAFTKLKSGSNNDKDNKSTTTPRAGTQKGVDCFRCGNHVKGSIQEHMKQCPARNIRCDKCKKMGHYGRICKSTVNALAKVENEDEKEAYTINLFPINVEGKGCYNCGEHIEGSVPDHKKHCPAKNSRCNKCKRVGHLERVCRYVTKNDPDSKEESKDDGEAYTINLFAVKSSLAQKVDFKIQVVVNNRLATVIADTGALISVCGTDTAEQWGILDRMAPSRVKIKPYNSTPIKVLGEARCAVSFGSSSIPVMWHIVEGSCEPILAGLSAVQLGIIQFNATPDTFQPVLMLGNSKAQDIQDCLVKYPENFTGIGKLKNHTVKLRHEGKDVKPIHVPPRSMQYHLKDRANQVIMEMIEQDVIEEHPRTNRLYGCGCLTLF